MYFFPLLACQNNFTPWLFSHARTFPFGWEEILACPSLKQSVLQSYCTGVTSFISCILAHQGSRGHLLEGYWMEQLQVFVWSGDQFCLALMGYWGSWVTHLLHPMGTAHGSHQIAAVRIWLRRQSHVWTLFPRLLWLCCSSSLQWGELKMPRTPYVLLSQSPHGLIATSNSWEPPCTHSSSSLWELQGKGWSPWHQREETEALEWYLSHSPTSQQQSWRQRGWWAVLQAVSVGHFPGPPGHPHLAPTPQFHLSPCATRRGGTQGTGGGRGSTTRWEAKEDLWVFIQQYQLAYCWSNWAQQAADWGFALSPFCVGPSIKPSRSGKRGPEGLGVHRSRGCPPALTPQHPQYEQCCLHLCSLSPAAPDHTTQSFFSLGLDEARETCQCLMKPHFHWLAPLKIFHLSVPRFKYFPLGGSQVCLVDYVARPFTLALTTLQQTLMSLLPPHLPPASPGWQSLDLFYFRPVLFQICFISDLSSSSAGRKRGGGGEEGG